MALLKRKKRKDIEEIDMEEKTDLEEFKRAILDLHAIVEQRKVLDKKEKELKEFVNKNADSFTENDNAGNKFFNFRDYSGKVSVFEKKVRRQAVLDKEKAEKFFREHGLYERVTEVVISQEKIKELVDEGEITVEDVQELATVKESYYITFSGMKSES